MPLKPLKPCNHFGCPNLVKNGYCDNHKKDKYTYDKRRGSAAQRGYNYRWTKYREIFLRSHPLCLECEKKGIIRNATVVDHIVPHKGDNELFWDGSNHQSLCKRCHDQKTVQHDGGFNNPINKR
jgi:5-methylcytosine-specific restriction enzyme A